jgi:DNA-binding NtrC family response regulator
VVAATNHHLPTEVEAGRFRRDLYFRLNGATVLLPPLRERPREIPILARRFLGEACARLGRPDIDVSPAAMQRLAAHRWPGNVRELKHAMEYACALVDGQTLELWHLPDGILGDVAPPATVPPDPTAAPPASGFRPLSEELRELERRRMLEALRAADGVQRAAAELIGMPLRTFAVKYKQYNLRGG